MKKLLLAIGCFGLISSVQMFAQDADAGKTVFDTNCSVCHNADSEETKAGPGLKGIMHKEELHNGEKVNDENVLAFISMGGGGMPGFDAFLTDEEKTNLIAYLNTL